MKARQNKGCLPKIYFTSDFHELVVGDLRPGPCVLQYDPLRLVGAFTHGRVLEVWSFVRFHPCGGGWEGVASVPARMPLGWLADPTGQGYMLESTFPIPPGCDELEVWFSHKNHEGNIVWDSEFGQNYWLRFSLHDLDIKKAKIQAGNSAADRLEVEVESVPCVERIDLRWRQANVPSFPRQTASLAGVQTPGKSKVWSAAAEGIAIPKKATVLFDLVYYVGGRKFTDDNQGNWYIAD